MVSLFARDSYHFCRGEIGVSTPNTRGMYGGSVLLLSLPVRLQPLRTRLFRFELLYVVAFHGKFLLIYSLRSTCSRQRVVLLRSSLLLVLVAHDNTLLVVYRYCLPRNTKLHHGLPENNPALNERHPATFRTGDDNVTRMLQ